MKITPSQIGLITAANNAQSLANDMRAAYWLECERGKEGSATCHRQQAWETLERLAELFGGKLIEVEPEQDEPEPVSFDDDLQAKCRALAEEDEAMRVKGML